MDAKNDEMLLRAKALTIYSQGVSGMLPPRPRELYLLRSEVLALFSQLDGEDTLAPRLMQTMGGEWLWAVPLDPQPQGC